MYAIDERSRRAGPQSDDTPRPYFVDRAGHGGNYEPSPDLSRLLAAIPRGASAAFTPEHLAALDVAIAQTRSRPANHRIDFRVSVPVFGRRYYFVLLGGKERRSYERLTREGHNSTWRMSLAYAFLAGTIASTSMVVVFLLLYVFKSMLGIDIFPEHSFLHDIFY